ncbi:MAG: UDP-N-acetylmuramoylalanyl-D-glutamyl-2,6-diaminopimelate--D-alanyl-D-alanine ligase [Nitratireductor sp.]
MEDLLWESDALIAAMQGRPLGEMPEGITGISIDSRTIAKGDAYFAIKGDVHDGHKFVSGAMSAGAAISVVAEEKLVSLGHISGPIIVVSDVLEAMRNLGLAARARTKAQIIAITGSVGKTTTKEMLRTALSSSGKVHASVASFNNHWGVPLTLARMPQDTRFGIFEIGMNHPDEIRPLVKMVRPHVAMINNVAAAHLGAFKNLNEIAKAKAEIFEGLVAGGYGLINRDDARFSLLSDLASAANVEHVRSFGEKRGADYWLREGEYQVDGTNMAVRISGKNYDVRLNAAGKHLVHNTLGVLGIASLVGADIEKTITSIASIEPEAGRGKRHNLKNKTTNFVLIDESYNANPASMEAALKVLKASQISGKGRKVAILGDMLELGVSSEKLHRVLSENVKAAGVVQLYTVGEHIHVLGEEVGEGVHVGHFANWEKAKIALVKNLRSGDVVMLKASNGLGFAKLVTALCEKYKK